MHGGRRPNTVNDSPALSLCQVHQLWRLNGDQPTTASKSGGSSENLPLDHILVNARFLDLGVDVQVDNSCLLSDHFPLGGSWKCPSDDQLPCWKWPAVMDLKKEKVNNPEWHVENLTYTAWAENAVKWLAEAYGTTPISKTSVDSEISHPKDAKRDLVTCLFLKAFGLLTRLRRMHCPDNLSKLRTIMGKLECTPGDNYDEDEAILRSRLAAIWEERTAKALREWRAKVKSWTVIENGMRSDISGINPPQRPLSLWMRKECLPRIQQP